VEYERFCEVVGSALTQGGLERAPLLAPLPHAPTADSPRNFLNFEERHLVSNALAKLAKFPDQLSNILEVFKVICTAAMLILKCFSILCMLYTNKSRVVSGTK
jgi:hypothetical protein